MSGFTIPSTLQFLCFTIPIVLLDGLQLMLYVFLLLPAFLRFGWFYVSCGRVSTRYKSDSCRNTLDIYGHNNYQDPETSTDQVTSSAPPLLKPVILFCPGGAWLIGYKMWGALLAKVMIPFGIMVVIMDYRNYPLATVPAMVQDVEDAIQWTLDHVQDYGGDPTKLVLVGQSAGGHLCAMVLLRRALGLSTTTMTTPLVQAIDAPREPTVCGFVSLSAPYDLDVMRTTTFRNHGMSQSFMMRLFGNDLTSYSPLALVENISSWTHEFPPTRIFHGTADKTVPYQGSEDFAAALRAAGLLSVRCDLYTGWSHTDPILEGVFDADHRFHRDLYNLVQEWTGHEVDFDVTHSACRRQCPRALIVLARWMNPF
jgi:prenylcysteine alpha-carboxyl methylesterase